MLLMAAPGAAQAQNLLKPGQGLVGAPPPIDAPPPAAAPKPENVTELPQVEVNGKRDPLSEADKRLRDKKKKLPGSEEERRKDRLDKLNEWYKSLAQTPNELNPDSQRQLEKVFDDGVHRETPGVPAVSQRRNPADYKDPIAATQDKSK
ncbi:MAG: hypothetical protein NVS9B10_01680 [Nevskia sp.]